MSLLLPAGRACLLLALLPAGCDEPPAPSPRPSAPTMAPTEVHHTQEEWDAIVAAADRSAAAQTPAPRRSTVDVPLSAEAAYAAIPHRRTRLDPSDPALSSDTRSHLERIFTLMDDGVRVRVHTLQECLADRCAAAVPPGVRDLRALAAEVDRLAAPSASLEAHAAEVAEAMRLQAAVFEALHAGANPREVGRLPDVRASSQLLKTAWRRLQRAVPGIAPTNRDAFFDHHCALDFI